MSLPYYKRFPRDFLEGTIGLSFEEKGAYAIILDLIYMRDGSLPDDARYIAGQLGCSVRKWSSLLERLVSAGKLRVENGIISNFRADYLLEETRKYRNKQAEIASVPRKNNNLRQPERSQPEPEPDIEAKASLSSPPAPTPAKARSYPEAFEAAWKAYPHAKGRSSKADSLTAWKKLTDAEREAMPGACERYRREGREPRMDCGAPAMERWIKRGLHQHWSEGPERPSVAPADPQVIAHRLRRFRDTGVWEDGWGERPAELKAQIHA